MQVFDCVIVGKQSDLDLLEARFTELEGIPEVVHVIAEATVDYSENPKPLWFWEECLDRFWPWHGRWNHVRVEPDELPAKAAPKVRKDALREYLAHAIAAVPGDVILHGGIDEIPAPHVVREIVAETGSIVLPAAFEMRWCVYRPDLVHPGRWRGTVAQHWEYTGSFAGLREQRNFFPAIVNAGTRLSMLDEEPQGKHPDGHVLWDAEIDDTWPKWVRMKFPC